MRCQLYAIGFASSPKLRDGGEVELVVTKAAHSTARGEADAQDRYRERPPERASIHESLYSRSLQVIAAQIDATPVWADKQRFTWLTRKRAPASESR
eukprot:6000238-Prymnesium_polylepis.2